MKPDTRNLEGKPARRGRAPESHGEDMGANLADILGGKPGQRGRENLTGLPDQLKAGIEALSGVDLSDVRVHTDSAHPAELGAHAYAQGTEIHLAPGQGEHLPHEAWHVAQQLQGRVTATEQCKGSSVNADRGLEHEADVMGARAMEQGACFTAAPLQAKTIGDGVVQRVVNHTILKNQIAQAVVNLKAAITANGPVLSSRDQKTLALYDSWDCHTGTRDSVYHETRTLLAGLGYQIGPTDEWELALRAEIYGSDNMIA